MASPLQGAWIYSNLLFQMMQNGFPIHAQPPRHVIANICRELLHARSVVWPHFVHTRSTMLFERELSRIDHPITTIHPDEIEQYVAERLVPISHASDEAVPPQPNPEVQTPSTSGAPLTLVPTGLPASEEPADSPSDGFHVLQPMLIPPIDDIPVEPPFKVADSMPEFEHMVHVSQDETPFLRSPQLFAGRSGLRCSCPHCRSTWTADL